MGVIGYHNDYEEMRQLAENAMSIRKYSDAEFFYTLALAAEECARMSVPLDLKHVAKAITTNVILLYQKLGMDVNAQRLTDSRLHRRTFGAANGPAQLSLSYGKGKAYRYAAKIGTHAYR